MSLALVSAISAAAVTETVLLYLLHDVIYGFSYPLEIKHDVDGLDLHLAKWKYSLTERLNVGIVFISLTLLPLIVGLIVYLLSVGILTTLA